MANYYSLKTSWSPGRLVCERKRQKIARGPSLIAYIGPRSPGDLEQTDRAVVIKSPLPSRHPASLPQPAPIEHSTAYLLQSSKHKESADEIEARQSRQRQQSADDDLQFDGNAVDWMLRQVDKSLDEVEENPPAYAKAIYDISTGPVGQAASKGAATAAKVTMDVGSAAIKAAAPVGQWVVKEGFKAAAGAVGYGLTSAFKKINEKPKQK